MGLITCVPIKRRRPRKGEAQQIRHSMYFSAIKGCDKVKVCKNAFLSLYSVTGKAMHSLTSLLLTGSSSHDMRGKHMHRGNAKSQIDICKIDEHIHSFPKKVAHYGQNLVSYPDSSLSVKVMYELFTLKHPDLATSIRFDVCRECEGLVEKLKSPFINYSAQHVAAAGLLVQKQRASEFYKKMDSISKLCTADPSICGITFDYMQNFPLPTLPVQVMFYLRKLWFNVVCIHSLANNIAQFYCYHEKQGKRGPDEVCTFLYQYIEQLPQNVKVLHVFNDVCGGKNRNHTVVRFLLSLTMTASLQMLKIYAMPCISEKKAYAAPLAIKGKKVTDVRKIIRYLPSPEKEF
ncbi:hypothetical protein PR048_022264 [Dryococelus australis]|uniref:Uncharacterized protein n=1 Tax=Dryococelus australis TaxID=614101 RepID=A0ABQ9H0N4_9NEOP|nr:hypothetical protein PR048_022264 [Dryococelus australis]